ncbi:MAG: GNAT family N-acetyltransferase [Alphaproteobacteria bacterium]
MPLTIEKLEHAKQHFDATADLLYHEFSKPSGRSLEDRRKMLTANSSGRNDYVTYVAHNNGVFLGTATFAKYDLETRQDLTPWLASVATPTKARRQGIGRQVVAAIEAHARAAGVQRLYLFTPDRMRFYHLMGWRTVETFAHEDGKIHTIMQLDL